MKKIFTAVLAGTILFVITGFTADQNPEAQNAEVEITAPVFDPRAMSNLFADISGMVGPSVVTITSKTTVTGPASPMIPWGFGFGFPNQGGTREYTQEGLGSGVIISPEGLIVTNNHVAGDADELLVVLSNGDEVEAKLIGADPRSDLALIQIEYDENLPAISLGSSDDLRVGEWVLAIGSPFALRQTVTQGIVSYLGRDGVGLADYESYIQTDAAINPGNSGGALVNLDGELIGVNTAIASRTGGYQGIGFAIPVNTVKNVVDDLLQHGEVRRGWLGVSIQPVTAEIAGQFNLQDNTGVLISDVLPDSPAENSGLLRGDVVISVNGNRFNSINDFRNKIADMDPGSESELVVVRDGRERTITVELGSREEDPATVVSNLENDYGWQLSELTEELALRIGAGNTEGVVVLNVLPGSPASAAGVQPGDLILEVNRKTVETVSEVGDELQRAVGDALLLVWRRGSTLFLVI
ncbi:MAG: DegQ family serine endoprotease [Candidatus Sabulitectum sp.]|nr:DegQ family serine endoprotease [Candidatus Sabulitectum sp.]